MTKTTHDSLLAAYAGAEPPRAEWFVQALAQAPERSSFVSDGAAIETLAWGERGKPGLLFLHGNGAHADWWSFIAPFFAPEYRCAAISWSGMGGSDWRERYTIGGFGHELLGAIDHAGLADAGPPVAIGHSFGGIPLMYTAVHHRSALSGGIMVDSFVPPRERKAADWAVSGKPLPRYATEAEALARYRFQPPQQSAHPEAVDYIARRALRHVAADADGPAGWTWKFDPRMWATLDRDGADPLVETADLPIGLIVGEQSALVNSGHAQTMARRLPDCRFIAAIPHARHHIMVDQPIALVAALRVGIAALGKPPY